MAVPRGYRSFADFEREEIRPELRIGWSCDELDDPGIERSLEFDMDPFEAALVEAEAEEQEYEEED